MSSANQYDDICRRYDVVKTFPVEYMTERHLENALGPLAGQTALDLACGTGYHIKRQLLPMGASNIVGIDLSPGMLDVAKATLPVSEQSKVKFVVGDATDLDVLSAAGLADRKGTFDIVLAVWLFNYASGPEEMTRMFRNAFIALKPGGRLIAITTNPFTMAKFGPGNDLDYSHLSVTYQVIDTNEYGYYCSVVAHVEPEKVEFKCWYFRDDVYDKSAKAGGFTSIEWRNTMPNSEETQAKGENAWRPFIDRPKGILLLASKPC